MVKTNRVRYAKKSCLSRKHTFSVFRLTKNGKNLASSNYVENLCNYLGDERKMGVLTANNLNGDSIELNQNDTETEKSVQVQETDTNSSLVNMLLLYGKMKKIVFYPGFME